MKESEMILGPRIPEGAWKAEKQKFLIPTLLMLIAAALLLISIFLPYWKLTLFAPQYPGGLKAVLYVNRADGDIQELDLLNHYIGMRPMNEAAPLERSLSIFMIAGVVLLAAAAIYVHSPIALFLTLPAIMYPAFFLGDLYFWLRNFGTNLDQAAPLSGSIKPFVPPILGDSTIAQFKTNASFEVGLYLSIAASIIIIIGLYFHRRAYKPLMYSKVTDS